MSTHPSFPAGRRSDPHGAVVLILLALSALATCLAIAGGRSLGLPVITDGAISLGLATGILLGVAVAQLARTRLPEAGEAGVPTEKVPAETAPAKPVSRRLEEALRRVAQTPQALRKVRIVVFSVGAFTILNVLGANGAGAPLSPVEALIAAGLTLGAAGLAVTACRYLAEVDLALLPEAAGLSRGARVLGWVLVLVAAAVGLAWANFPGGTRVIHYVLIGINGAVCYDLFRAKESTAEASPRFPTDLRTFSILGSRPNPIASFMDAIQRQLGIDLRSTWALTVVRQSMEPTVVGLCVLGWLCTAVTVVGLREQGIVERLGVPVAGPPLAPGLHLHWPWPLERVVRVPVRQVRTLAVGHKEEEGSGPEDVLWARQHAESEYTLLLGNGRDLIAVDAAVQYRITDPRAWHYHCQNPVEALRAIGHRAVMKATVNRTLAETLSENVATLSAEMRSTIQAEANALGLGIQVVNFTVGGMHPPVAVAPAYQAVVSAALGKVTDAIDAQAFRNETVPRAKAGRVSGENAARADGAEALGKAAGEAWAFRALTSIYALAPEEYRFRRRLETLERVLGGRRYAVVDSRIQRDGGELWLLR